VNAKELNKFGFPKSKIYDAHNKYYSSAGYPSRETRKKYTDYCTKLIDGMTKNKANKEELERALLFSYICVDSIKYRLNILAAKEDLEIDDLYSKYVKDGNTAANSDSQ
jgi:hypothetical protein